MTTELYRYWILPASWRRWPRRRRYVVCALALGALAWVNWVPFGIWRPAGEWNGLGGYFVPFFGMIFLSIVNIFAALAAAPIIASERERGTWDSLIVTTVGVRALVLGKLMSRVVLLAGIVALVLPFWLTWAYEVLEVNPSPSHPLVERARAHEWLTPRMAVFLIWLAVRIVGRVLPFAAIGAAISARCRQTRRALLVTASLMIPLTLIPWVTSGLLYMFSSPGFPGSVLVWPFVPNDYESFPRVGVLSSAWKTDAAADVFWLLMVPLICLQLAARWSSRTDSGAGRRPSRVSMWIVQFASSRGVHLSAAFRRKR